MAVALVVPRSQCGSDGVRPTSPLGGQPVPFDADHLVVSSKSATQLKLEDKSTNRMMTVEDASREDLENLRRQSESAVSPSGPGAQS